MPGDLQFPGLDFDPNSVYAPVASHESIRVLLSIAAANGLIVKVTGDVCNAYVYGDIDTDIYIEQPIHSTAIPERPGYVCKLRKSI